VILNLEENYSGGVNREARTGLRFGVVFFMNCLNQASRLLAVVLLQ